MTAIIAPSAEPRRKQGPSSRGEACLCALRSPPVFLEDNCKDDVSPAVARVSRVDRFTPKLIGRMADSVCCASPGEPAFACEAR